MSLLPHSSEGRCDPEFPFCSLDPTSWIILTNYHPQSNENPSVSSNELPKDRRMVIGRLGPKVKRLLKKKNNNNGFRKQIQWAFLANKATGRLWVQMVFNALKCLQMEASNSTPCGSGRPNRRLHHHSMWRHKTPIRLPCIILCIDIHFMAITHSTFIRDLPKHRWLQSNLGIPEYQAESGDSRIAEKHRTSLWCHHFFFQVPEMLCDFAAR